jgi:hypothetical protein
MPFLNSYEPVKETVPGLDPEHLKIFFNGLKVAKLGLKLLIQLLQIIILLDGLSQQPN